MTIVREQKSRRESTGWQPEISAIASRSAKEFGNYESIGDRVSNYYAMIGRTAVLLLCGGDKRTQSADLNRAITYLNDYRQRTEKNREA